MCSWFTQNALIVYCVCVCMYTHRHTHLCLAKRNSVSVLLAINQKEIPGSVINQGSKAPTAMQPWCSHDMMCEISSPFKPRCDSERSFTSVAGGEVPRVGWKAKVTVRRGPIFSTHTRSRWLLQRCGTKRCWFSTSLMIHPTVILSCSLGFVRSDRLRWGKGSVPVDWTACSFGLKKNTF